MNQDNKILQFIIHKPLLTIFIFLQIILIITFLMAILQYSSNSKESTGNIYNNDGSFNQENIPEIKVSALESLKLPSESITNIQRALTETIKLNNQTIAKELNNVVIREKKYKNFSSQKVKYINFILDIPESKQSYQIRHEWSDEESNSNLAPNESVAVFCLRNKDKIKYKDFKCKDNLSYDIKYSDIGHYIQFATISDLYVAPDDAKINSLIVDMTNTSKTEQQAQQKIEKWINSMGYSPKGFKFEFKSNGGVNE